MKRLYLLAAATSLMFVTCSDGKPKEHHFALMNATHLPATVCVFRAEEACPNELAQFSLDSCETIEPGEAMFLSIADMPNRPDSIDEFFECENVIIDTAGLASQVMLTWRHQDSWQKEKDDEANGTAEPEESEESEDSEEPNFERWAFLERVGDELFVTGAAEIDADPVELVVTAEEP